VSIQFQTAITHAHPLLALEHRDDAVAMQPGLSPGHFIFISVILKSRVEKVGKSLDFSVENTATSTSIFTRALKSEVVTVLPCIIYVSARHSILCLLHAPSHFLRTLL
jgi:hypothetical protein